MQYFKATLICAAITLQLLVARLAQCGPVEDEVNTSVGKLSVTANKPKVYLNGQLVEELPYDYASIEAVYPSRTNAKLILISVGGGNWCDGYFQVIEVQSDGHLIVTPEFGECRELAEAKQYRLLENPIYENSEWRIALPLNYKKDNTVLHWYTYKDGAITFGEKPAPRIPGGNAGWTRELDKLVPNGDQRTKLIKQYGNAFTTYRALISQGVVSNGADHSINPSATTH